MGKPEEVAASPGSGPNEESTSPLQVPSTRPEASLTSSPATDSAPEESKRISTTKCTHGSEPAETTPTSVLEAAAEEELEISAQPRRGVPTAITRRLYLSHLLSTWNSRSFEFGAVLFLAAIYPGTLLYLSIYALVRAASAILFSSAVGRAIDTKGRLPVVRFSIIGQRLAVILSCVGFYVMLVVPTLSHIVRDGIFAALILLSCVEKNCSVMNLVSIERDWVVVIGGHHDATLQTLNARMRRIDLICKLIGPLFIALVDGASSKIAILVTLGLNIVSVGIEYFAIAKVYTSCPELQIPRQLTDPPSLTAGPSASAEHSLLNRLQTFTKTHTLSIYRTYRLYTTHPTFAPSFALSLLYLTVLSMSSQMSTYLLTAGFTPFTLAAVRVLSVLFELSATWLAPRLMRRMSPPRAGLWFLSWQMSCLAAGLGVFFARASSIVGAAALVAATILSRTGLWSFDLAAQSIIQTTVTGSERGAFSATEASFQNFFELLSYVFTIIFSRPDQFKWPILVSVVAVYCAGGVYGAWVRRQRGHLVHLPAVFGKRVLPGEGEGEGDGERRRVWRQRLHDEDEPEPVSFVGALCCVHPWAVDVEREF